MIINLVEQSSELCLITGNNFRMKEVTEQNPNAENILVELSKKSLSGNEVAIFSMNQENSLVN